MRRVTSTNLLKRTQDDKGATAVMAGLMIVVLLGIGAFVLDIGNQMWERRLQQNAADAAALAVAKDCAEGECGDYEATALDYGGSNNFRGINVASIEPDDLDPQSGEVAVTTQTGDGSVPGSLTKWLAGLLDVDEISARARAKVIWGSPTGGPALPITIGLCEWQNATGLAWDDEVDPEEDFPTNSVTIYTHDPNGQDECLGPAGQYNGAGFGHLEGADAHDDRECTAMVSDGTVDGENGNMPPDSKYDCSSDYFRALVDNGTEVLIPIFIEYETTGGGGGTVSHYEIGGFGGFVLDGYKLGGNKDWQHPDPPPCSQGDNCLQGRFVSFTHYGDHDDLGGIDLGAQLIVLSE